MKFPIHAFLRAGRKTVGGLLAGALLLVGSGAVFAAPGVPDFIKAQWPKTNFAKRSIDMDEIMSGGPPKAGIPSLADPKCVSVSTRKGLGATVP